MFNHFNESLNSFILNGSVYRVNTDCLSFTETKTIDVRMSYLFSSWNLNQARRYGIFEYFYIDSQGRKPGKTKCIVPLLYLDVIKQHCKISQGHKLVKKKSIVPLSTIKTDTYNVLNPFPHTNTCWHLFSRWLFENIVAKGGITQNEQFVI